MRILDRYLAKQLIPVWLWCLAVFIFLTCVIDLFERLDDILRYHIPSDTVVEFYASFVPIVFVRAAPLALLLAAAFVGTRLTRYHELLAMNASGTSLLRASVPFLFVGWLASMAVFFVNDRIVPDAAQTYERIRHDAFRSHADADRFENVAIMDASNRLYHARELDLKTQELRDLTVLEHDLKNRPTKSLYASRAIWTKHGWLLLGGTIYRVGPRGVLQGEPVPFVERLVDYPVALHSFSEPEIKPETMRFSQLQLMITRLRQLHMPVVRRYTVELLAKLTLPLMCTIIALIGFVGSTRPQLRGYLKGLGTSLGWGVLYYFGVGFGEGIAKNGILHIPVVVGVWAPHAIAVWACLRVLRRSP